MAKINSKDLIKRAKNEIQHRSFSIETRAIDEEKRTIELAFSSDKPVNRGYYYEVLDHSSQAVVLDRLLDGGPVLIDHVNSVRSQVGIIETVRIDPDMIGRSVVRLGTDALSDEIFQKVKNRIIRNISVGYQILDARIERAKDGDDDLDTLLVSRWEPLEVSFVAVPADSSVGVGRSFEFLNEEEADMPEDNKATTGAPTNQPVIDQAEVKRQAEEQAKRMFEKEQKRINDIMTIGAQHARIGGVELADKARADNTTVQEFQEIILRKIAEADKGTEDEGDIAYGQGARTHDRGEDDKTCGFGNFGHFCRNVVFASMGRNLDPGLEKRAASVFSNTESGPDGGYAIPEQFGNQIVDLALAEQGLLALAENTPLTGNSLTFPKDEGTPWGTTGVTAQWEGEGNQTTPTKNSELEELNLKLRKLKVLVAASDELIADATAMSAYLMRKMSTRLEWKVQDAIVNGTGAGMPLGLLNSGCIVTQAKESGQTADTIVKENIAKMFGRVLMGAGANLVWLINPDSYNQIVTLNSGGDLIWSPDFRTAPGGALLGRPVIMTDTLQTLGDKNDIVLANMAGYQTATKSGGVQMSQSMHLWFDQDLEAFKLIFRMDGKPLLKAAVTPPNSSVTRSHFVNLAARA